MIPLEQLSVYLPYSLTCYGASDMWTLTGLTQKKVIITNGLHHQTLDIEDFNVDYSILLRPLSQLTEEIEIDGERFVPLVELAKIAYPRNEPHEKYKLIDNYVDLTMKYTFHYVKDFKTELSFDCRTHYNGKRWDYNCFVPNQYNIYRQLFKWHFDVFGLIDKGLAEPIK